MIPGLTDIVSESARKIAYLVYALLGLTLGAIQVGFSSAGVGQPVWLTVALSVFAFVGTGLGLTAAANVSTTKESADI